VRYDLRPVGRAVEDFWGGGGEASWLWGLAAAEGGLGGAEA
jgi:hypothetical protein